MHGLRNARLWLSLAAIFPVVTFWVPIWGIVLYAPQYPEGITMHIWIDKMSGQLDLVNGLNHYIGMKPIVPESIPELRWMPWIVLALVVTGLWVAWRRSLFGAVLWTASLSVLGILGLYDFYLWGYDYGHNLDPHAPIQVPGMSYQPPLIGVKELLNFTAISYPHVGAFALGAAFLCGLVGSFLLWQERSEPALLHRAAIRVP
jgi:copper chaperone NosL